MATYHLKLYLITCFILLISNSSFSQEIADVLDKLDKIQKELDSLKEDDSDDLQFSVGGNVNFLEETRLNGLYYDISLFLPKIFKEDTSFWKKWGLEGRLAQGRLDISNDTTSGNLVRRYRVNDTTGVHQTYRIATKEQANYLNLSLNPTYPLGAEKNVFLVLFFEYFRRTNISETSTIIQNEDTIAVSSTEMLSSTPRFNETNRIEQRFDLFNFAIGLKLYQKIGKNLILNIRPVIGVGTVQNNREFFYHTRFEVAQVKKGFKFGGEIRGLTGDPKQEERATRSLQDFYSPFVNIYVAKTFGFNALGKFLLGN